MHLTNPQPNFWIILQESSKPGDYTMFLESWRKGFLPNFQPGEYAALIRDLCQCPWARDAKIISRQEVKLSVYPSAGDIWELICKFEKLSNDWRSWRGKHFAVVRFEDFLETFYQRSVPSFILSPYQLRLFGPSYIEVWEER